MDHEAIEELGFTGRIESLRRIKRFASFRPMFYRPDLYMHTIHNLAMIERLDKILQVFFSDSEIKRMKVLALVHDDHEPFSKNGDVEYSAKLRMTPEEQAEFEKQELIDIRATSINSPRKIYGFNYEGLLLEGHCKDSRVSQAASFIDKLQALGSSIHEALAGNKRFFEPVNGNKPPYIGSDTQRLREKYTLIADLFKADHLLFAPFQIPELSEVLDIGKPHTKESILHPTGIAHYDFWKFALLEKNKQQGLEWLTKQVEF